MSDAHVPKILIIDDEKTLQAMLRIVLSANGFEVVSALSGEEGLVLAKSEKPSLILLDVIMPGIKGREVCRLLKADPQTKDIPVLFLTSKNSVDDLVAELQAGAIDHITKPINPMALVKTLQKVLAV